MTVYCVSTKKWGCFGTHAAYLDFILDLLREIPDGTSLILSNVASE